MEWLKVVRDWSEKTLWNWFTWHSVSIKWIPLFLDRESIKTQEDKWLKFEMFEKQMKQFHFIKCIKK